MADDQRLVMPLALLGACGGGQHARRHDRAGTGQGEGESSTSSHAPQSIDLRRPGLGQAVNVVRNA
jgi:hypothetical protein